MKYLKQLCLILVCLCELSLQSFAPYWTNDCHTCKASDPDAYFCRQNNIQGVCCSPTSTLYACQESESDNIVCSNSAPSDFYYGYCMNSIPEKCGASNLTVKVENDNTTHFIRVRDIAYSKYAACAWTFFDRNNGFLKFGGEILKV